MKHSLMMQGIALPKQATLVVMVAVVVNVVLAFGHAYAETPVSVPCVDGTTGTAIRTSQGLTSKDYDAACKGHGGAAGSDTYTNTGSPTTSSGTTVDSSLSSSGTCPPDSILGIPAWYSDLRVDPSAGNCELKPIGDNGMSLTAFIVKIALNVIRAGLVLAGYIAVFFIIKGGFGYIMAQGEPSNLTAAKQTITNAIIGLIIALLSAAIVGAIAGVIK